MIATTFIGVGLFLLVYGFLTFRDSYLKKKSGEPTSYRVLRLRENSKTWLSSKQFDEVQTWFKNSGLSMTLGEGVFYLGACLLAVELILTVLGLIQHPAFILVGLLTPFLVFGFAWFYVQHRIDKRRRILLSDFIHCFSRLADFVHYKEVTDYQKIRRSLIGTRILHQALPSEVVYRTDPRETLKKMEEWVAFDEERLLLRNALQEALYSIPDEAEKSLIETVGNLRYRKAAQWKKELRKVEMLALIAPYTNAGVFALIMIVSLITVVRQMMGW